MSQIKLLHSGGNGVILAAPSSNPASDRTLTLPGDADGTIATTATAGKVLQVVSTTKTTAFSSSSTSYTDVTGFSSTITPSSSSNKVYVMVHVNSSADIRYAAFRLVRGSTNIAVGTDTTGAQEAVTFTTGTNNAITYDNLILRNQSMAINDSPSTTSATTYKLQGRITYGTGNFYVNRTPYTDTTSSYVMRAASTITLYEIAA